MDIPELYTNRVTELDDLFKTFNRYSEFHAILGTAVLPLDYRVNYDRGMSILRTRSPINIILAV